MNASGDFLIESYANMTPIGVPHRYVLDLNGKQNLQGNIWVDGQKHFEPSDDSVLGFKTIHDLKRSIIFIEIFKTIRDFSYVLRKTFIYL